MINQDELKRRAKKVWQLLSPCLVCPRRCGANWIAGQKTGFCQMGAQPKIAAYYPHFGEEACLVGNFGSGTIFFSSCNLACVYCQNWEISQERIGEEVAFQRLAAIMLELQKQGCHNLNLVSPTIWVPQILKALVLAVGKGLKIPLVYNTGGYDRVETLKLLDGVVDIYMPDIKYSDNKIGAKYSFVSDYWDVVQQAVKEMHRQVGDLVIKNGLAVRGLLVRHLVLPHQLGGTEKVMNFLAQEISPDTYVNLMAQYRPENKAYQFPKLTRRIASGEYAYALQVAQRAGLSRFDKLV